MKPKYVAVALGLLAAVILAASIARAQSYSVIHNFTGSDGKNPASALAMDGSGNLYGTSNNNQGNVFKIKANGDFSVLYTFTGRPNGNLPDGSPVLYSAGTLYGTTYLGGRNNWGSVFKWDKGLETVLYSFRFSPPDDGFYTRGGLVMDRAGNLYGTTQYGGAAHNGTVFKLDSHAKLIVVHRFAGPPSDGSNPSAGLILDTAGNLYGTTRRGGASDQGTVFKRDASGHFSVLHSFASAGGMYPSAPLVLDTMGNLYGTTVNGGGFSKGTVFKLDASGRFSLLHSFAESDGTTPQNAGLNLDANGNLYGTTSRGGAYGLGTVFMLDSSGGHFTVLHSFAGSPHDGAESYSGVVLDTAGNLYGTTSAGGTHGNGTIFKLSRYAAQVQQPINSDQVSVFRANGAAVPVRFTLTLYGIPTCTLPPATIAVQNVSSEAAQSVNETGYTTAEDLGSNFRIDQPGCRYLYNLGAGSLAAGTYQVNIVIGGAVVGGARFILN